MKNNTINKIILIENLYIDDKTKIINKNKNKCITFINHNLILLLYDYKYFFVNIL